MPTPRKNRPSSITAAVAAAWATMAGCMRMSGAVTPVPMRSSSVASAMPPRTDHTNGLWPCSGTHGWKWSEMPARRNPVCSARAAFRTSVLGSCSSHDSQ